jgi:tetratricopeptide (TPR) repeat protein
VSTNRLASPKRELDSSRPNYWSLLEQAARLVSEKKWEAAKAPLKTLIERYPGQTGSDNAYALLAAVHRGLNETLEERATLEKWAAQDDSAPDAYLRLMELGEAAKDWKAVSQNANRFLAVNPLFPQPYRSLARASEELSDAPQAIAALEKLLLLDPPDPADVHFRLASLLRQRSGPAAKRHVLQALEEAPRFRKAHRLLLELAEVRPNETNSGASDKSLPTQPTAKP